MITIMNNVEYNTLQASRPNNNSDTYLTGLLALGGFLWFIGFLIFVLWIWSMFSTILLNKRFTEFLEYVEAKRQEETQENVETLSVSDTTPRETLVTEQISNTNLKASRNGVILHPSLVAFLVVALMVFVGIVICTAFS